MNVEDRQLKKTKANNISVDLYKKDSSFTTVDAGSHQSDGSTDYNHNCLQFR